MLRSQRNITAVLRIILKYFKKISENFPWKISKKILEKFGEFREIIQKFSKKKLRKTLKIISENFKIK